MKTVLKCFFYFVIFHNLVFCYIEPTKVLQYLPKLYSQNDGLDYKVAFQMKSNNGIYGDISSCFGSLITLGQIKYLVTSTECLKRKGTKIKTQYWATSFTIYNPNYQYYSGSIAQPFSQNITPNSILLIELPSDFLWTTNAFQNSYPEQFSKQDDGLEMIRRIASYNSKSEDKENYYVALLTHYFSKNLLITPLLYGLINSDKVGSFKVSRKDFENYSITVNNQLYGYFGGNSPSIIPINPADISVGDSNPIRDFGASLVMCTIIKNINNNLIPCNLIGVLTGKTINNRPIFKILTANDVYVLRQGSHVLTAYNNLLSLIGTAETQF